MHPGNSLSFASHRLLLNWIPSNVDEEIGSVFVLKIRDIPKRDVELKCYTDSKPVIDWMKQGILLEGDDRFLGIRLEHIKQ